MAAAGVMRWTGRIFGTLLVLVLLAILAIYLLSERALSARGDVRPSSLAVPTAAQLADGPRQLDIMSCTGCHAKGLRGSLFFDEPNVARIYAPNLSLLAAKMSDAQLDQAIRQGIGHDGRALFIMPSQQYQFLTDQEMSALIKAIRAVPPGGAAQPANWIGPMGRVGLALGKFESAPAVVAEYRDQRLVDLGPDFALGRHIVETNCTECHGALLEGRMVKPGSVSPNLDVVKGYDLAQFTHLLRTGESASGKPLGLMGEVTKDNLGKLNDAEIKAVYDYLEARTK